MRVSPGCIDALGKGWIVEVRGVKCRLLGRASPTRWRIERIDTRETGTLEIGAPEMAKIEDSLRGRGKLG